MISAVVNALVIVFGSLLGVAFRKKLSQRYSKTITQGLGLCVMVIGISTALETAHMIVVIICVALGALQRAFRHIGSVDGACDAVFQQIDTQIAVVTAHIRHPGAGGDKGAAGLQTGRKGNLHNRSSCSLQLNKENATPAGTGMA